MTLEENLAHEMADIVRRAIADANMPLQKRIEQLEVKTIEQAAELRVLKEVVLSSRDEKHLLFGERAHRLGTN